MHICLMYQKEFLKGTIKTVLLCLLDEHEKMYGYEITQLVKARTANEINLTEGALYPALHKLEANGFVATFIKKVDGRNRKYYQLTAKGKKEAINAKNGWIQFNNLIGNVINTFQHA